MLLVDNTLDNCTLETIFTHYYNRIGKAGHFIYNLRYSITAVKPDLDAILREDINSQIFSIKGKTSDIYRQGGSSIQ